MSPLSNAIEKTIGNEGVKHNIKFEEQNNRIIKGVT